VTAATSTTAVGVIGPGRAGTGLALAWVRAGHDVRLHGRRAKPVPAPLTLTTGPADAPPPWIDRVQVIVFAVPDDAIAPLARTVSASGVVRAHHVVLHLSGSLDKSALAALQDSGAALGSLHPLQTLVEPERAPDHLHGAWAAVEGDPRAVETAERLARDIGLHPFRLRAEYKTLYHAGAVFASNYFVVVEAIAQQLFERVGLERHDAWAALAPLVRGTFENLTRSGPAEALTGPVVRGDAATLERHLAALPDAERALYRQLGRAVLELARRRGLDAAAIARLERTLATG
jgi:predicted short-subunit dehydrogenase-like oxidoreductase (DUF2520 family)